MATVLEIFKVYSLLGFPAEKYALSRYGIGQKKETDVHLEEDGYILNNLISEDFFHAECLCLLYLTLFPSMIYSDLQDVPGDEK